MAKARLHTVRDRGLRPALHGPDRRLRNVASHHQRCSSRDRFAGFYLRQPGSARAFSRTVRDVIRWRGQTRNLFDRIEEVDELPPMRLFWGTRDTILPISQGIAIAALLENCELIRFQDPRSLRPVGGAGGVRQRAAGLSGPPECATRAPGAARNAEQSVRSRSRSTSSTLWTRSSVCWRKSQTIRPCLTPASSSQSCGAGSTAISV